MSNKQQAKQKSIVLFKEAPVRRVWVKEEEKWYFSVVDVVRILTDSVDSLAYWRKLKERLKKEGNETVTNCHGLKMLAADGKMRLTDIANTEQLFRLIQSIPSRKAEPFKVWLSAELSTTHIAKKDKSKGYDENAVSAKKGGGIAKRARKDYELQTGQKVISENNFLQEEKRNKKLEK